MFSNYNRFGHSQHAILIRNMTVHDIPYVIDIQRRSYPKMSVIGEIWEEGELENYINLFPQGQFCAEIGGKVVASASSLIIKLEPQYKEHSWYDICYYNVSKNFDPQGTDLYDVDVSVSPDYRRLGIASKLYEVRKALVQKLNMKRIISGSRLANYHKHAKELSVNQYVQDIIAGKIQEPSLNCQLRNGFKIIKALPNYLDDEESLNYAVLIEWLNGSFHNQPFSTATPLIHAYKK